MPNTASTITNTQPQMPFHFIPDKDAASHLSRHILFAHQEFSKVDIEAARNRALEKFKEQSIQNLSSPEEINNPLVAAFLNPENHKSKEIADLKNEVDGLKEEFNILKNKPTKLQNPQEPLKKHTITSYVQSVEAITQNINNKFAEFLKREKAAFHEAYKPSCPDEEKRKKLWEMYETNLKKNIQEPLGQFTKEIDGLVPHALTYYVNRLGLSQNEKQLLDVQDKKINEKLNRKLQYTDSKGKPIIITKDKKTGQPSEIRIDPMSSLFGKSGDIGDAYAILAAYHGKDVPIRVVVPTFIDDNIYTEMKDFIALLIFLIFAQIYKHLEKNHYLKDAKQAALDKGISLDNITLVDAQDRPINFSKKDKAEINKKLKEKESEFLKNEEMVNENFQKKVPEQAQEENSQPQQPSLKPSPV